MAVEKYKLGMTMDLKWKDKTLGKGYQLDDDNGKTVKMVIIRGTQVFIGTPEELKI